jgi:acyl carrier protein
LPGRIIVKQESHKGLGVLKSVQQVFSETLGIEIEQVVDDLEYNSITEWDSVAHMGLIAALEDTFDVMIETDDVIDMNSVAMAKKILVKYGVKG